MTDLQKMLEELKERKEVTWRDQYKILKEVDVVGTSMPGGEVEEEAYGNTVFGFKIGSPKNGIAKVKEGKHPYNLALIALNGPWVYVEVDPHLGFYKSGRPRKRSKPMDKKYQWVPPEITFEEKRLIVDKSNTIPAHEWVSVCCELLGEKTIYEDAKDYCEENYVPYAPCKEAIREAISKVLPQK